MQAHIKCEARYLILSLIITERNDPLLIDKSWFNKRILKTEHCVPCVVDTGYTKNQLKSAISWYVLKCNKNIYIHIFLEKIKDPACNLFRDDLYVLM